jgi:hypothetical protein
MGRGVFMSASGVLWVRAPFCWLAILASFLVGVLAGFAWILGFAR